MKINIKLRVTPEQSEAVQKICFDNGFTWPSSGTNYICVRSTILISGNTRLLLIEDTTDAEYTEVDADLFIRTNGTCEESVELVNNLLNSKSKEAMFKQYGFEVPNFDCTILAKVEDKYIGYVTTNPGVVYPTYWYANGCRRIDEGNQWNLIPAKQPWYETCKFPVLVWDMFANKLEIATYVINDTLYLLSDIKDVSEIKPLSNDEINQLKQDF